MDKSCLFISLMNGDAWGGSEELWYRCAHSLAKKGIKTGCAVYDWKEKEEKLKILEEAGSRVYRLPNLERKNEKFSGGFFRELHYKSRLREAALNLPVKEYATVIISQGGFEIVHFPWKRFHQRLSRYVLIFHNYNEHKNFSPAKKKILSAWLQSAAANLFAAGKIKTVLQKQLNIDIPNASVVYNPITFQPPANETPYPVPVDRDYIFSVFAALDVKRKAQDRLIRIIAALKWKERPFKLYLYGEGKDKDLLRELIEEMGLQEKVILKGHTSDVVSALRETHLVLHVTDIDAMPISVVEAMAMSRPLVVTDVGDMPKWMNEGRNGWVTGTSPEAIDACLEKAWQAKENWPQMGAASFRIFQEKYPLQIEEDFINKYIVEIK